MNQKIEQRCTDVVTPALAAPLEYVRSIEVVQLGKVSARKQIIVSLVVGILTAGMLLVALRPRAYYLVLTNQRLLLLDNLRGRVGTKIVLAVPLNQVVAGPLRTGALTYKLDVEVAGVARRFSWGRVQGSTARRVAEALGAPARV